MIINFVFTILDEISHFVSGIIKKKALATIVLIKRLIQKILKVNPITHLKKLKIYLLLVTKK